MDAGLQVLISVYLSPFPYYCICLSSPLSLSLSVSSPSLSFRFVVCCRVPPSLSFWSPSKCRLQSLVLHGDDHGSWKWPHLNIWNCAARMTARQRRRMVIAPSLLESTEVQQIFQHHTLFIKCLCSGERNNFKLWDLFRYGTMTIVLLIKSFWYIVLWNVI